MSNKHFVIVSQGDIVAQQNGALQVPRNAQSFLGSFLHLYLIKAID